MSVRRYQDLRAWQFCVDLRRAILALTRRGPVTKDRDFCRQLRTSARAAPSLIAEGFVRFTPREFVRYLRMARAELAEVENDLGAGREANHFSPEEFEAARKLLNRAMGTTTNLLKAKLRQLGQ